MPRGTPAAGGPRETRPHHGRGPLPTPNPSKTQQSASGRIPAVTQHRGRPHPRERPGGDRRRLLSQSNPSGQGSRRRCPPGHRILAPAGPTDPRKGKGEAPGRRDGRRRAPSTPKPPSKPPNMARGGGPSWSSRESDRRPEEQASEETR
ncbi:hypothetical protein HPG69_000795 [Diceros bicornis minor]|uniref:Uncharacterized protein n=1 Tax=Diceros bicornis minor TaxID=77932 RepID=A0A7J7E748_DICBM|nr:hypothetical protein HPG69_000795 [Diceros bicornis minor]